MLAEFVIAQMRDATEADEPFLIVHNEMLPHWPVVQTPADRAASPPRPASLGHMIGYMDTLAGRLLDAVEDLGIRKNTYVFFMADNGTHEPDLANPRAGEPGQQAHTRHTTAGDVNGGKFSVSDGGTHVPFLVWGPVSVPRGRVCDDLVDVVDLMPTLCELGGVTPPENGDGHSLVAQLHGRPGPSHAYPYGAVGKEAAVFDGQWRLKRSGTLLDARFLPDEPVADESIPAAATARRRFQSILDAKRASAGRQD